ncbi:hypothetical protein [Aliarcobacter butzleri]|uniref:hypothetical protein n=1 Tax=Aliarcobacter butzleri TaxID=28197 RepID=UPI001EDBB3CE|nr:hypothetical protein [Aliarcobacter butzleri]MCG3657929.1 hypothetical protein [Aliarcobacter butzleri]
MDKIVKNNALQDIANASTEKVKIKGPVLEISFNFLSKVLFSYLPLVVYCIVNIPYYKGITPDELIVPEQDFLKGMFLALSYVFISQVNNLTFKPDSLGNLLYGLKIFSCIFCIALFATNKFNLNYLWFFTFFIVSLITLFFTVRQSES